MNKMKASMFFFLGSTTGLKNSINSGVSIILKIAFQKPPITSKCLNVLLYSIFIVTKHFSDFTQTKV